MANPGNAFRNCIKDYIDRWGAPLEGLQEVNVGFRFVGRPRKDVYKRQLMGNIIAAAIKMGESNACMRRIVAAPTAGASGVLPCLLYTSRCV